MKRFFGLLIISAFAIASIGYSDASAVRVSGDTADGDAMGAFVESGVITPGSSVVEGAVEAITGGAISGDTPGVTITVGDPVEGAFSGNMGWNPKTGQWEAIKGSKADGVGTMIPVTITVQHTDGSKESYTGYFKADCKNVVMVPGGEVVKLPPSYSSPSSSGGGGGGCECGSNASPPSIPPKPADAPAPAPQHSTAYVSATSFNKTTGAFYGGGNIPDYDDTDIVDLTPEEIAYMTASNEGFVWAKPRDEVGLETISKAAHINGYTNSYAKVTTDLGHTSNPRELETREDRSGKEISLNPIRIVVAEDVGKVFTGLAHAKPMKASLTWSAITSQYVMGYNPVMSSCTYRCNCTTDWEDYEDCDDCVCNYIGNWDPVYGSYISGWSANYSDSGEITKIARIYVPFNYELDIPEIEPCVEVPPFLCWPNHGVTHPGEDLIFENKVTIKSVLHEASGQTYATNSKPSTYEIISFVLHPDSVIPGRKGISEEDYASTPLSGDSCTHYTDPVTKNNKNHVVRDCEVVQREVGVFFNTKDGVSLKGRDDSATDGTKRSDTASYDVEGNELKSLSPSIIIDDDVPIGSKICVALSVWPANSKNGVGRVDSYGVVLGSDMNAESGGNWSHGEPYCMTIAKKPSTQFWGAGVYSEGSVSTSQSVKYVPYESGFTASQSNPGRSDGLSSDCSDPDIWNYFKNGGPAPKEYMECLAKTVNDNSARLAFGSWSEYEAISNKSIKGLGTGAALGYQGVFGQPFLKTPGGFPTAFPSSNSFTSSRICAYSSQTFSNAVGAECNTSITQGGAGIKANTDLTLDRLISRYSSTPCTSSDSITIGSDNACSTSPDGVVHNYASDNTSGVTLDVNGVIPKGRTVTVTVPGKLTIARDIKYADVSYDDIANLPQVILIADSIDILPNVSQVDAWLVAGGQSTSLNNDATGVINTCAGFKVGADAPEGTLNACNNNSLTVNGPVFASKLALNRTAGADPGYGSINPAERFNLRADSYLWSYAQAQRYSQAVVTYSRELAPRY